MMTTKTDRAPQLGEGVYTFSEVAGILRGLSSPVTTRQLRYWMSTGLAPSTHVLDDDVPILSFDDLISLEIVRRFRAQNVSLQGLRRLETRLRELFPGRDRPFAYKVFFTDGANVWVQDVGGEKNPLVEEVIGKRRGHWVWREAIKTFAEGIRFSGPEERAVSWALTPWVEIDPSVQFGAPVVAGTRVPVSTIEANLQAGSPREVADWYGLNVRQVEGVREYLAAH
jgi:uncharacterized protein (DUF433 family)